MCSEYPTGTHTFLFSRLINIHKMPHASLTREAVAAHNKGDDLWCIIDHKVYDLTDFVDG